jgi:hypothetical protein
VKSLSIAESKGLNLLTSTFLNGLGRFLQEKKLTQNISFCNIIFDLGFSTSWGALWHTCI